MWAKPEGDWWTAIWWIERRPHAEADLSPGRATQRHHPIDFDPRRAAALCAAMASTRVAVEATDERFQAAVEGGVHVAAEPERAGQLHAHETMGERDEGPGRLQGIVGAGERGCQTEHIAEAVAVASGR